ncbi:MAG: DHH family phosphoesterase [Bacteroidetes bacterium]|nr:DHH family phosphoesterase [Bacteroidota bacterium]
MINHDNIHALRMLLSTPRRCVIVTHPRPDADAIGSSLGWRRYLELKGHSATFISPTHYTANLAWIKGTEHLLDYEDEKQNRIARQKVAEAEVIFVLDFNVQARAEKMADLLIQSTATKVMIDHHQQPEGFAAITFSDTTYAATAEMVYDVICALGDEALIDADIAEDLYAGLVADTGFFQHSNTTPNVFKVASGLIAHGASPDYVSDKINNVFDERRLHYFGYALLEKLKVVNDGRVAYISIGQSEARRFNLQLGDNEGLVNYAFKISSVKLSVLFSEERDKVKISFRSKDDIDVNAFARKYYEGGGHRNASGGKSLLNMEETEKRFIELSKELFQ